MKIKESTVPFWEALVMLSDKNICQS